MPIVRHHIRAVAATLTGALVAATLTGALVAAALIATTTPVRTAEAAPALQGCPGNRLANPGFEGGSRKTEREGTSLSSAVADGWHPWFVRGNEQFNREPEFKLEQVHLGGDPRRVRSGGSAMKWFSTWSTHTAGIYQPVNVPAGANVTFSIYGLAYSGEADGWSDQAGTFVSDPHQPGNYRMAVGIDPTGAAPAGAGAHPPATVIWSGATGTVDQWVLLSVQATARANKVTVYAKGWPEWGVKHNNSFWDDACLMVTGRGPIEPSAAPDSAGASEATDDDGARSASVLTGPAASTAPTSGQVMQQTVRAGTSRATFSTGLTLRVPGLRFALPR